MLKYGGKRTEQEYINSTYESLDKMKRERERGCASFFFVEEVVFLLHLNSCFFSGGGGGDVLLLVAYHVYFSTLFMEYFWCIKVEYFMVNKFWNWVPTKCTILTIHCFVFLS